MKITIHSGLNRPVRRLMAFLLPAVLCLLAVAPASAQTLAFPGAQGFGEYATGGRNGTVYHVTSLADSGTGSFRDAVSQGNRCIVFDVGGTITLASAVTCSSDLTIAGQTAPGGIAIIGHEVSMSVRTNEIVRFLRIRPGSIASSTEDGINMGDGTNMIFDHVSIEFAPYNNIDAHGNFTGGNQISFQNSILADPIGQQFNAHTEALNNNFFWYNDILASAHNRNPLAKVNTIYINNVVYNFQLGYTVANTSGNFTHDIVNNYFITGPSTSTPGDDFFQIDSNQKIYATGNLLDSSDNGTLTGSDSEPTGMIVLTSPWSPVTSVTPTVSATAAFKNDVSFSGALPRDQVDQLVINDVNSLGSSGQMWTSQTATGLGNNGYGIITGGATPVNTSGDGIPDYWKLAIGLNINIAYPLTNSADGYTPLEHYLNWLAAPHATTATNTVANIDLSQYTAGFITNATYTVNNGSNGTVVLTGSHTVQFTPPANFAGLGSFSFIVNDGVAMTNTVVVCISAVVQSQEQPIDLTWHGDGVNNVWSIGGATNWFDGTNYDAYSQGDNAIFNNTGSTSPSLALTGDLIPGAITFNDTLNYTMAGTGAISGPGLLTKTGSGTLTIDTTNSGFTGNINLSGGTLAINTGASIGSGNITLSGGATINLLSGSSAISSSSAIIVPSGATGTIASGQLGNTYSGNLSSADNTAVLNLNGGISLGGTSSSQVSGFSGAINIPAGSTLRFSANSSGNTYGATTPNLVVNGLLQPRNAGNTIILGALNGSGSIAGPQSNGGSGSTVYNVGGNNENALFSGSISSNSAVASSPVHLIKVGTGQLILTGVNTFTGTNAVTTGSLLVNGTNNASLTTVYSGATLGGSGVINGAVTVASGGVLSPGSNTVGTLTINGQLTGNTPTLSFSLSGSPTGVNDLINLTGPLVMSGVQTFNFNLTQGSLANGTYPLITGGSGITLSGATLTDNLAAGARQTFTLTNPVSGSSTGFVSLVVSGSPGATLVWQGTNGSAWDNSTTNWLNGSAADKFYNLDTAVFNDSSANGTVIIAGTLQPQVVIASNSATTYTLGGGALTGAMQLIDNGAGNFILNNTNTFTGGIVADSGDVILDSGFAAGTGPFIFNGGAITLAGPGLSSYANALIFLTNSTIVSSAGGNNTAASTWAGTNVTANVNIPSGIFSVTGLMTNFSGTMEFGSSSGSFRFNLGTPSTYDCSKVAFDLGTGTATLLNRNGNTTITMGSLAGGPNTTLTGAGSVTNFQSVYNIGSNNLSTTFAGVIKDGTPVTAQTFVVKMGTGTWTLTGASTFGGGLTVSSGALRVNNTAGSAVGTGPLEVMAGATLMGTGTIGGTATMDDYSTLSPGDPAGTLTFTNGLTLNGNTLLTFALGTHGDSVIVEGNLFLDGQLEVTDAGGFGPGTYTLFTYSGALNFANFTLASAPVGYLYTIDTNTVGLVNLDVSLSPPVFGNIAFVNGSLILAGSGGQANGTFYLLSSTNLSQSMSNWTPVLTNQFDDGGNFDVTNLPAGGDCFYRLFIP